MGTTEMHRVRWAAIGAAVAVSLGAGGLGLTHATLSTGERTSFVPITPCRLADTRPGTDNVGPLASPVGPAATFTLNAHGVNGNCNIAPTATGLSLNVTAVGPTAETYLTIYPTGAPKPVTSNLNPKPGQPPTPNAVNVDLNAGGQFDIFNFSGSVDVIVDVIGYYEDHDHDDRYYTKAAVDAALAAQLATIDERIGSNLSVPAAAFVPRYPGQTSYEIGSGAQLFVTGGTQDTFVAPVYFPDGATLQSISPGVWDDAVGSLTISLMRIPRAAPSYDAVFSVTSTGDAPGAVTLFDGTPSNAGAAVVDNFDYSYFVYVTATVDWVTYMSDLRLHTVFIEYALP